MNMLRGFLLATVSLNVIAAVLDWHRRAPECRWPFAPYKGNAA